MIPGQQEAASARGDGPAVSASLFVVDRSGKLHAILFRCLFNLFPLHTSLEELL